jgi:hypothetical protein
MEPVPTTSNITWASLFILVGCLGRSGLGRAGSYSRAPACSPGCTGSTAAAEQREHVCGARGGHRIKKIV